MLRSFTHSYRIKPFLKYYSTSNFPKYIKHRLDFWEQLMQKVPPKLEEKEISIKINGDIQYEIKGISFKTKPRELRDRQLHGNSIVCKVNGVLWDLNRPLEEDCTLEFLTFDSIEGKEVFWHSSSHLLGAAMEQFYKEEVNLFDGPAIEQGFYYDVDLGKRVVHEEDFSELEKLMKKLSREKEPFIRMVVSKEEAQYMFEYNKYKLSILNKIRDDVPITLYKCGNFIDLCTGPHVMNTSVISSVKLLKTSSVVLNSQLFNHAFKNTISTTIPNSIPNSTQEPSIPTQQEPSIPTQQEPSIPTQESNEEESNEIISNSIQETTTPSTLIRIYGISFPKAALLEEWIKKQEEAKARDHRIIGKQQELFMFHKLSPGSPFFLPRGTIIFNRLVNFLRKEYKKRGYQEVITPQIYNKDLWKTSGHWDNYKDDMFILKESGLKPMNCPGHCLIYSSKQRSFRDLPIRLADFSPLHRNEISGALTGLTRVIKFHQDDAHIFCRLDQVQDEMKNCLDFIKFVYQTVGFEIHPTLSTRPKKFMGTIEQWNQAEEALKECLKDYDYKINEEDGAFYGPKIDICIRDAIGRLHQCATVQLDFQLPQRFKLAYKSSNDTNETPVMIHRAILGSVERFIGILTEHYAGKWPFWLSPRQAIVCTVNDQFREYAHYVANTIQQAGDFIVDVDESSNRLQKQIREAQLNQYNYILVVGKEEEEKKTINVRTRDGKVQGEMTINELIEQFKNLQENLL